MSLSEEHYDAVIIGAGMSGLAAGIRLAHYGHRVIILEKHSAPGGLNSFYFQGGRQFDVGLHAMTNYVPVGIKGTPLVKLLRQLRISRDEFDLSEQKGSRVVFQNMSLGFNNNFDYLESEVAEKFPAQIDKFRKLVVYIRDFNETALDNKDQSARECISEFIDDLLLLDMILLPLMYYGSAQENDMDFSQFIIMFKSIYFEGFARPFKGVQQIIKVLLKKYKSVGGERRMKCGVRELRIEEDKVSRVILENGDEIRARYVLSSAGLVETMRMCDNNSNNVGNENIGRLSFVEMINVMDRQPSEFGWDDTIVFFNQGERFKYACPEDLVDPSSGVICMPNNYKYADGKELKEGLLRITAIANFSKWCSLSDEAYSEAKQKWFEILINGALDLLPDIDRGLIKDSTIASDMFTPRTVEKFTSHLGGAVYGAPNKHRDGSTDVQNLFICGTDQGFLGIVGAMLSGISMANYHVLRKL